VRVTLYARQVKLADCFYTADVTTEGTSDCPKCYTMKPNHCRLQANIFDTRFTVREICYCFCSWNKQIVIFTFTCPPQMRSEMEYLCLFE